MSEEKLLDAFGQIGEEFIEEADPRNKKRNSEKKGKRNWMKWTAYAACAVLVLGIGASFAMDVYLGNLSKGVDNATTEEVPEAAQGNGEQDVSGMAGESPAEGSETEDPWVVYYNEAKDYLDSARVYIPGYFTEELSEEDISAIEPDKRLEWMQYSGHAGFDGDGKLVDVCLMVTTTIPEEDITITISEDGLGRCYVLE